MVLLERIWSRYDLHEGSLECKYCNEGRISVDEFEQWFKGALDAAGGEPLQIGDGEAMVFPCAY